MKKKRGKSNELNDYLKFVKDRNEFDQRKLDEVQTNRDFKRAEDRKRKREAMERIAKIDKKLQFSFLSLP